MKKNADRFEFEFRSFDVGTPIVGVASDAQLPPFPLRRRPGVFERNLLETFRLFARRGVNFIVFAGDLCNLGSKHAYRTFRKVLNAAYGGSPPPAQCVLGNHDYRLGLASARRMRRLFEKELGQSPFTHFDVGGYRFLGASPENASKKDAYRPLARSLKAEIERALAATPQKPVFVTTHNSAKDTVYRSDAEGDLGLSEIFAPYDRVVNLAGHSHASVFDAGSIHQKDFTSLTAQATSYVELEPGKTDGPLPPRAVACPAALILTFGDAGIAVEPVAVDPFAVPGFPARNSRKTAAPETEPSAAGTQRPPFFVSPERIACGPVPEETFAAKRNSRKTAAPETEPSAAGTQRPPFFVSSERIACGPVPEETFAAKRNFRKNAAQETEPSAAGTPSPRSEPFSAEVVPADPFSKPQSAGEDAEAPRAADVPISGTAAGVKFLPLPFSKDRFLYAERKPCAPPSMPERNGSSRLENGVTRLRFRRAVSETNVRSYLLQWSDGTEQSYFSDFYFGKAENGDFDLAVYRKKHGVYDVKIYAVDAYGQTSADFTRVNGVRVLKRRRLARLFAHGKASIWKHL